MPPAAKARTLVLQLAVDVNRHVTAHADDLGTVPFARRPLAVAARTPLDRDASALLRSVDRGAAQPQQIARAPGLQLTFDSLGPELVAGLHALENAAVRRLADPPPLDVEPVVAVDLLRTHVPERMARDADTPVPHGEGLPDVGAALRIGDAHPSGEVPAVEKFGFRFAAARTGSQRKGQRRKKEQRSHHRIVFRG